jgi:hypothetical protein
VAARTLRWTGMVVVLAALVLWNSVLVHTMATRLKGGDFRVLYLSALAHLEGRSMYALPPEIGTAAGRTVRIFPVNLNPPHFQLLLVPLARMNIVTALAVWTLAGLLSLACCLWLIVRELHIRLTAVLCWRTVVWLLAFIGMGEVLGKGQVSFLLLLPFTLAWIAARRGRWVRAGAYLGVLMTTKLFLLVFLPYLLLRRRIKAVSAACSTALACVAVGASVFGLESYRAWLQQFGSVNWAWQTADASILGLLSRSLENNPFFTPLVAAPSLIWLVWVPAVVTIASVTFLGVARDRGRAQVDRAFAILVVAALLISPLGWIYYLWFALGPVVALGLEWQEERSPGQPRSRERAACWRGGLLAAAAPALVWPHFGTFFFQPHPWATVLFGSAYFWGAAALWGALVTDCLTAPPVEHCLPTSHAATLPARAEQAAR